MTKLLLRLFVKDAQNPDSPTVRLAVGKLAGVVGILCNALLCLGKVLAGGFGKVGYSLSSFARGTDHSPRW